MSFLNEEKEPLSKIEENRASILKRMGESFDKSSSQCSQENQYQSLPLQKKIKAPVHFSLVPCRARGMPKNHTFRNAHFRIPDNIDHGTEVICSHEKCASEGVKFKFCCYCWMPVAKRNFNRRHNDENSKAHQKCSTSKVPATDNEKKDEEEREFCAECEELVPLEKNSVPNSTNSPSALSAEPVAISDTSSTTEESPSIRLNERFSKYASKSQQDFLNKFMKSRAFEDNKLMLKSEHKILPCQSVDQNFKGWMNMLNERPALTEREQLQGWLVKALHMSERGSEENPIAQDKKICQNNQEQNIAQDANLLLHYNESKEKKDQPSTIQNLVQTLPRHYPKGKMPKRLKRRERGSHEADLSTDQTSELCANIFTMPSPEDFDWIAKR